MIPAEAVEAAADIIVQGDRGACECRRSPFDKHDVNPPCSTRRQAIRVARAALEAAAPILLSHEREQTRLAHLDAMVNRDAASRLEPAITGVLELAAPQRHMVPAAEIREWIASALELDR